MQRLIKTIILPLFIFGCFSSIYIHNLSHSVYGGDVGDVVTAAATFGVAHPPGYPLFTFLGLLLTKLTFLHESPAFLVGLISAFSGSLGVLFFYLFTKHLTKNTLVALIATTILGFSFLYWFYAEIAEVFALNAFFAILLFYLSILFKDTQKKSFLFFFFFILGLSCTHHATIVLIFPSLFLLIAKPVISLLKKSPSSLIYACIFLFLGLTPFLYIPIASSHQPIINWDNVHDLQSFFHLILRKDYGTFQAGIFDTPSWTQRFVTLQVYLQYLVFQLTIPTIFLICVGFFSLFKKDKLLFSSILLAWILSGPVFLAYAGFPLTSGFIVGAYERFTLLSSVIFLMPLGFGLVAFSQFLAKFLPQRNYTIVFQSIFFFIPLMLCIYNFPKTNLATTYIGDTYAEDFIETLPYNAILLTSGDTQIFNTWYVHYVLHVRPDVLVYNIGATPVGNNFIASSLINVPAKKMMDTVLTTLQQIQSHRPVFSLTTFESKSHPKFLWMPYGLTYEMFQSQSQLPSSAAYQQLTQNIWEKLHIPRKNEMQNLVNHSLTISEIPNNYAEALVASGTFAYTQYKNFSLALSLYQKAVAVAPQDPRALAALGILYTASGKCSLTVQYLTDSLAQNPYQDTLYFILYNTYATCLHDKKTAGEIAQQYTEVFQKDFQKDFKKAGSSLTFPTEP